MVGHLDQPEAQRNDNRGRLIGSIAIVGFEFPDFRGQNVIGGQILSVSSNLPNAAIPLECLNKQRLYQHRNAVGPERVRVVIEFRPATDQGDTISVQAFRCNGKIDDKLPAQDASVRRIACRRALGAEAIYLWRWRTREHAASHERPGA